MRSQDSISINSITTTSSGDYQSSHFILQHHQHNLISQSALGTLEETGVRSAPIPGTSSTVIAGTIGGSVNLIMGTGTTINTTPSTTSPVSVNSNCTFNNNNINNNNVTNNQGPNWSKLQALKQRKVELEKSLNEKNVLLQQLQKQESQIITGSFGNVENCNIIDNGSNTFLRRKVGTSFKLPKNLLNSRDDGDIEKLLLDKKIQQEICNASLRLSNDPSITKTIRRIHKTEYEAAQEKLIAINQNLSILKRRQCNNQTKSNSESIASSSSTPLISLTATTTTATNLTKSPSFQQQTALSYQSTATTSDAYNNNLLNSNKYGSNNSVNNYYTPSCERRNSIKSTTAINTAKHLDTNERERILKAHRSEYDLNQQHSPQQYTYHPRNKLSSGSYNTFSGIYNPDFNIEMYSNNLNNNINHNTINHQQRQDNVDSSSTIAIEAQSLSPQISGGFYNHNINVNNNGSINHNSIKYSINRQSLNLTPTIAQSVTSIQSEKYYLSPTQQQYEDTGGGFIKSSQNIRQFVTNSMIIGLNETEEIQEKNNSINDHHRNRYSQGSNNSRNSNNNSNNNKNYTISNMSSSNKNKNNTLQYQNDNIDGISLSPSSQKNSMSLQDQNQQHHNQHQQSSIGLGGYWRTLPNNEKVWSTFDGSYETISSKNPTQPVSSNNSNKAKNNFSQQPQKRHQSLKASSLGNFDTLITTKDDCVDQISISSMNSESSKKPKEKQWLETSLDGPIIRTKIQGTPFSPGSVSMQMHNYNSPPTTLTPASMATHSHCHLISPTPNSSYMINNNDNVLTLTTNSGNGMGQLMSSGRLGAGHLYGITHSHQKHHGYRERSKLSSQSMSNGSYRVPQISKLDEQVYLSQSTSVLNAEEQQMLNQKHSQQQKNHQSLLPSLNLPMPPSSQSLIMTATNSDKNYYENAENSARQQQRHATQSQPLHVTPDSNSTKPLHHHAIQHHNPLNSNSCNSVTTTTGLPHTADIRIESPKNMTVIQQATFMPYKEVTKPFEMSDFYKYSTKFRQKETGSSLGWNTTSNNVNLSVATGVVGSVGTKQPMPLPTEVE